LIKEGQDKHALCTVFNKKKIKPKERRTLKQRFKQGSVSIIFLDRLEHPESLKQLFLCANNGVLGQNGKITLSNSQFG
jgi:hypothetical protein